ncbi:MAG: methyltransferase domain-containing protein [Chloroflexia bacterium]|nr:methyltransferase domain-containing protein [Chloroflexia bacterium]
MTANPGSFTAEQWHAWFCRQAQWTQATRRWLYRQAGLARAHSILEVGCGSGAVAAELAGLCPGRVFGLDIDTAMLEVARRESPRIHYLQGDAQRLPFAAGSLELVLCHYLLLWLDDPGQAVAEMARVLQPEGRLLACAEPDYGGRIDHPPELVHLGQLQARALRRQGANPDMGRRLGELFSAAGLECTTGVMAGRWQAPGPVDESFAAEWAMRRQDLAGLVPPEELTRLEELDRQALLAGRRLLFVPTFYALGRKR